MTEASGTNRSKFMRLLVVTVCLFLLAGCGFGQLLAEPPARTADVPLSDLDRIDTIDLAGHTGEVGCAAFSGDGARVATVCYDRAVRVFDSASGKLLHAFPFGDAVSNRPDKLGIRTQGLQNAVAFSPDGTQLVAAGGNWLSPDSLLTVFDLAGGAPAYTVRPHRGMIRAVAFSSDGKSLITACHDGTVKVLDAATGAERNTFTGHDWVVTAAAASPDGHTAATVSCNSRTQSVRLWDPATLRQSLNIPLPDRVHSIEQIAFSPDGKRIAGVSHWRLHAWDTTTGVPVADAVLDAGLYSGLAYSPDGRRIAVAGGQGGGDGKGILRVYDFGSKTAHLVFVRDVCKELITVAWPAADKILVVGRRGNDAKLVSVQLRK
jgi:WD40 repeat protein